MPAKYFSGIAMPRSTRNDTPSHHPIKRRRPREVFSECIELIDVALLVRAGTAGDQTWTIPRLTGRAAIFDAALTSPSTRVYAPAATLLRPGAASVACIRGRRVFPAPRC